MTGSYVRPSQSLWPCVALTLPFFALGEGQGEVKWWCTILTNFPSQPIEMSADRLYRFEQFNLQNEGNRC